MSQTNIIQVLKDLSGASFIGFDSRTDVTIPGGKKNIYQGRIVKVTRNISAMIYENKFVNGYENAVRKSLAASGIQTEFNVGPRAWGTRVPNTPIVEHKGQGYLEVIVKSVGDVSYELDDGTKLVKVKLDDSKSILITEESKEFITDLPPSANTEGQQGGLDSDDQIIIRTYKMSSISELRAYKNTYHDLVYIPE